MAKRETRMWYAINFNYNFSQRFIFKRDDMRDTRSYLQNTSTSCFLTRQCHNFLFTSSSHLLSLTVCHYLQENPMSGRFCAVKKSFALKRVSATWLREFSNPNKKLLINNTLPCASDASRVRSALRVNEKFDYAQ